jgi:hypothetical protein
VRRVAATQEVHDHGGGWVDDELDLSRRRVEAPAIGAERASAVFTKRRILPAVAEKRGGLIHRRFVVAARR